MSAILAEVSNDIVENDFEIVLVDLDQKKQKIPCLQKTSLQRVVNSNFDLDVDRRS